MFRGIKEDLGLMLSSQKHFQSIKIMQKPWCNEKQWNMLDYHISVYILVHKSPTLDVVLKLKANHRGETDEGQHQEKEESWNCKWFIEEKNDTVSQKRCSFLSGLSSSAFWLCVKQQNNFSSSPKWEKHMPACANFNSISWAPGGLSHWIGEWDQKLSAD